MTEETYFIHERLEPWPNAEVEEGYVLSPLLFMHALGCVVTDWNMLEQKYRYVVAAVSGLPVAAVRALLTHVGADTLTSALYSTVELRRGSDAPGKDPSRDEVWLACTTAARAFDVCRGNRNFLVHKSQPMHRYDNMREKAGLSAYSVSRHKKSKAIKISNYAVGLDDIRRVADECWNVGHFLWHLEGPLRGRLRGNNSVALPKLPEVPQLLTERLKPITDFNPIVSQETTANDGN
ncbi:hypothetical protein GCM10007420_14660 [Glycocaulis albus]|uniref:Uncharacterized protein n=1 Tax=Glycocaulis albus TaxID=1382801 RepID=A0ABQ1XQ25_9PROT|nr:hypothetical protein [Glycocaulis albus]GGG99835.1 hypothetical protein GCM10007420_14660 [Glycocaulis albus]